MYVDAMAASASDSGTGTAAAPFKTIAAAMSKLRPGDDVVVAAGSYRESVVVPILAWGTNVTRLRAQVAHTVTIKGSDEIGGWVAAGSNVYSVAWSGEEPEQVFRSANGLRQIGGTVFGGFPNNPSNDLAAAHADDGGIWPGRTAGGVAQLVDNSFTYDSNSRRLVVKLARALSAGEKLEVSVRRHVLQAENANGVTVDGLDFAHSNTSYTYRQGAVKLQGNNNLLKDVAVRDMDAVCVQLIGTDSGITNSTIERCGQVGITGRGTRLTISNNRVTYANSRGFNKWWEAGGMKLVGTGGLHSSTIRGNTVAYNAGDGIWIDWKNTQNLIEGNTTAYNDGFGIHYEASQTGTIRANLSYGNAMRGIYLMESANCIVNGNSVFANMMEGIAAVNGTRSANDPELLPVGNQISGNSIAWNDINRNWVQLALPGNGFATASDRNVFKASGLAPRMSLGFVSSARPAYESLQAWRAFARMDYTSTEQTIPMPDSLNAALVARRLLLPSELPVFLSTPGVQ